MADAGGFEPPTAWFVARYSIQLSYASVYQILYFNHLRKMADAGGFEPPTAWFVARYSIQLSYASVFDLTLHPNLGYSYI